MNLDVIRTIVQGFFLENYFIRLIGSGWRWKENEIVVATRDVEARKTN